MSLGKEEEDYNMNSQEDSPQSVEHSDCDTWDNDDCDVNAYYFGPDGHDEFSARSSSPTASGTSGDPEMFEYETLTTVDVERFLNESVEALCAKIAVSPALAKLLLHNHKWKADDVVKRYQSDYNQFLIDTKIKPKIRNEATAETGTSMTCRVCLSDCSGIDFLALSCGHKFCKHCWLQYIESQLMEGKTTGMECMEVEPTGSSSKACVILIPEDFVLIVLSSRSDLRAKYEQFFFRDHVKSHPELRFCVGPNCESVLRAKQPQAKKAVCKTCSTSFCFKCGSDYHAPTDCDTIKKWLLKCADDSETANYIAAHTKDCPKCLICIEKNGGCNHMQCFKCKYHFCWMCLGGLAVDFTCVTLFSYHEEDWKAHGSEYYECSRYKENPDISNQSQHVKAREALQKYLFYFERWENHNKSLKLEEQMLQRIKDRIDAKIANKEGTWIDWQYLYDAAALLTKCRYTLQYTYPFAYYLEASPRKQLFEYQQAQMEREIENLSWKVERAETTDRGDLESQMCTAEQKRRTLLRDFLS